MHAFTPPKTVTGSMCKYLSQMKHALFSSDSSFLYFFIISQNNCICIVLLVSKFYLLLCEYECIIAGCGSAVALQNANKTMNEMHQSQKGLGKKTGK